jgi:D-alanyl-lipoteichoic acid acyltransferase DltB (MBOAT superfamily)
MAIENAVGARRRSLLLVSLVANVGTLAVFKYSTFLIENVGVLGRAMGLDLHLPVLHIVLPIGLSFHTFQAMSYTIEVYRGHQRAERHLGLYALYVMFYPQLVAGPIERPQNLLHQFREVHRFDPDRLLSGLRLMIWGMFKKVVIADRVALYVSCVYADPRGFHYST